MTLVGITADGYKLVSISVTGPASDTVISVASAGNVSISISSNYTLLSVVAVKSVSGLPDGVVLNGISITGTSTVTLKLYNTTGSDATVTANSVTVELLAKAI